MEFSPVIDGGIKTVGEGTDNSYFYNRKAIYKKEKFSLLRVGEIVYGRISIIINTELASVKLPIGTFTASIHKNIKQGDELYFKVEEVSPNLILKVHSVSSSIDNNPLSTSEIIRILDIPNDETFNEVVEFLRHYKNLILRNDILLFVKFYDFIRKHIDDSYIKKDVLKTIYRMREGEIEPEIEIFKTLYIGCNGERTIQELLNTFIEKCYLLPPNSRDRLLSYFEINEGNEINLKKSMNFFSQNGINEESFYQISQKILQINSINKVFQELQSIVKNIIAIVDSGMFWNLLALSSCTSFIVMMPLKVENIIKVAILSLSCNKSIKTALLNKNKSIENAINFDFTSYLCNRVKANNVKFEDFSTLAYKLSTCLQSSGLNLRSFTLIENNGEENEILSRVNNNNRLKLSIVV